MRKQRPFVCVVVGRKLSQRWKNQQSRGVLASEDSKAFPKGHFWTSLVPFVPFLYEQVNKQRHAQRRRGRDAQPSGTQGSGYILPTLTTEIYGRTTELDAEHRSETRGIYAWDTSACRTPYLLGGRKRYPSTPPGLRKNAERRRLTAIRTALGKRNGLSFACFARNSTLSHRTGRSRRTS